MTERERRFCELYAGNPNATEAAKAAGYSHRTAYSQGSRLLRNVEVLEYINELQEDLASRRIASMTQVRAYWSSILHDPAQKTSDRLKAGELLARAAGAFVHIKDDDGGARYMAGEHNGEDVVIYLPAITGRDGIEPSCTEEDVVEMMQCSSDR